ncbi:MAG: hydrogenase maturation nickel metallochaperone HypA [Chlorobi bacterium]|nr:hydrogenase maturation nickel metallochaperone HypA [Chlorobiota bacterium]
MHELSIAMSIVEIAEDYALRGNAGKVLEMDIEVGDMSGVVIDALEFALQEAVRNTRCEQATWKIIQVHPVARCPACGWEGAIDSPFTPCPDCGEYGLEIIRGKELQLKSLVVDT